MVNQQIEDEFDPLPPSSKPVRPRLVRPPDADVRDASLSARVSTKLDAVDFRGGVCLECSEDSIAEKNDETILALQAPSRISEFCPPPLSGGR